MSAAEVSPADALDSNQPLSSLGVWFILLALLAISFVSFTPSYIDSFVTDDYKQLQFVQPLLEKPYAIYEVFNPYFLGWYYRPTQLLFFAVFRLLFGTNPLPYYVGMLLLHAINIVLVYRVARTWGIGRFGSIYSAGLFSVVASHQDAIGWISAVSVLLAAAFSLLALHNLRTYLDHPQRTIRLVAAIMLALFALLSREEAVVLLPVFLSLSLIHRRGRPKARETGLFAGFGLLVAIYLVMIFVRPTWTLNADALMNRSLANFASIHNLGGFLGEIVGNYVSTEIIPSNVASITNTLALGMALFAGLAFWRGNAALRLGVLWTAALLLFLYVVIWLEHGAIAHHHRYLPWLGVSFISGAVVHQLSSKHQVKEVVRMIALLMLIGNLLYQAPRSRQRQQQLQHDADSAMQNGAQIRQLVPEVSAQTHFFAYDMPPVTDYIQSMAAVWYDTRLDGPGGYWKRLLSSGYAGPDDYLLNLEDGLVYNLMPELQAHEATFFIWQENPVVEIVHLDGTTSTLSSGAYALNQIVGPPGQRRFGFYLHPPAPEEGWATLTYTAVVPPGGDLMFAVRKDWGQVNGEDGMTFRVNLVDTAGIPHTIYRMSLETIIENWTEPSLPMDGFAGQSVLLQFQVEANANLLHDHGYWANPRFVVGD